VILDLFDGGVVLFYPFYNSMAFMDVSLGISRTHQLLWTFNYGFKNFDTSWKTAYGFISDSVGTGSLVFILVAGIWAAYRHKLFKGSINDKKPHGHRHRIACRKKHTCNRAMQDPVKKIFSRPFQGAKYEP